MATPTATVSATRDARATLPAPRARLRQSTRSRNSRPTWNEPEPTPKTSRPSAFPELTEREREILDRIVAGDNNAKIAAELYLSPKTVRINVSMILSKLQATDRASVILRARDAGFGRAGTGSSA